MKLLKQLHSWIHQDLQTILSRGQRRKNVVNSFGEEVHCYELFELPNFRYVSCNGETVFNYWGCLYIYMQVHFNKVIDKVKKTAAASNPVQVGMINSWNKQ